MVKSSAARESDLEKTTIKSHCFALFRAARRFPVFFSFSFLLRSPFASHQVFTDLPASSRVV